MNLPCVDIVDIETGTLQDLWNAIGGTKEQLVHGVLRNVQEIAQIRFRSETQLLGLRFGHQQTR